MERENQGYATRRSRRTIVIQESEKQDEGTADKRSSKKRTKPVLKKQNHVDKDDNSDLIENKKETENRGIVENFLVLQTPRRSSRRSIRPAQDYQDIILMSSSKKKTIMAKETVDNGNYENSSTKWTPSSVGRSSEKRTRKSKRVTNFKDLFNAKDVKEDDGKTDEERKESEELTEGDEKVPKDFEKHTNTLVLIETNKVRSKLDKTFDSNLINNEEDNKNMEQTNNEEQIFMSIKNEEKLNDDVVNPGAEISFELREIKVEIEVSSISCQIDETPSDNIVAKVNDYSGEASDDISSEKLEVPIKSDEPNLSVALNNEEITKKEEMALEDAEDSNFMKGKIEPIHDKLIEKEETLQFESSKNESMAFSNKMKRSSTQPCKYDNNEKEDESFQEVKQETDNFGNYLKSNKIDISDLGLKPLDEDVNDEMPSLLIIDDSLNPPEPTTLQDEPKLNETFDASDSIIIVEEKASKSEKEEDIVLHGTTEIKSMVSNIENKEVEKIKKQVRINPEQASATPEKPSKVFRTPTPHKSKAHYIFSNIELETDTDMTENKIDEGIRLSTSLRVEKTELENIDIPVRRRSNSLTLDKPKKNVYFHSPANQTTLIDDLDALLSKKKNETLKDTSRLKNVTIRRKRSLSVDDLTKLELPKPTLQKPTSLKKETKMRTKLPNFAAIHQRNFEKMENLEEFLERKAERAKLLNSGSKVPSSSSKKNVNRLDMKRDATGISKASKKIDLGLSNNIESEKRTSARQAKKVKPTIIIESKQIEESKDTEVSENIQTLPNPCDSKYKTRNLTISQKTLNSIPPRSAKKIVEKKILQPTNASRPAFNLSTMVSSSSKMNSSVFCSVPKGTSSFLNSTSSRETNASRLQRRMEMFKGRPARKGNQNDVTQRQNEIIKGVRSNRRFELQMQHRRNFES